MPPLGVPCKPLLGAKMPGYPLAVGTTLRCAVRNGDEYRRTAADAHTRQRRFGIHSEALQKEPAHNREERL